MNEYLKKRSVALELLLNLTKTAGRWYWQEQEGQDSVHTQRAQDRHAVALADAMTYIDSLVDEIEEADKRHVDMCFKADRLRQLANKESEYSPAVQALIDKQNKELYK